MRSRQLIALLLSCAAATPAMAQDRGDPMAGGLVGSDYLRVGAGVTIPVNPQGSLRDWSRGTGVNVVWESWRSGNNGVARAGFGLGIGYSLLPLKESEFIKDFTPLSGGNTTGATASRAGLLEITSTIRLRIPMPIIMPTVNFGFGFINWAPGTIQYTATSGSGSVKQQHRSGAEISIGGGLDRQIYDRWAAYVDAAYVYGFTSFGRGFANPGGVCATNGCDPLKNTTVGTIRGGLRIRTGR